MHQRDSQTPRELGFTRQTLAVAQHTAHDRIGQALLHELGPPGAVKGGEDD
jgi:hypothetical protein